MGAARICPRCLVRLVTNHDHTRIWCPVCKRQIRLAHHGEESGTVRPAQPATVPPTGTPPLASRIPTLPPPIPCAIPVAQPEWSALPVVAPRERPRHRTGVLVLAFLFSVALVAGGAALAFYQIGQQEDDRSVNQAPHARTHPTPAAARERHPDRSSPAAARMRPPVRDSHPALPAQAQPRPALPRPTPPTGEALQQQALRAVFQTEDPPLPAGAKVVEGARRIDELVRAALRAKGIAPAALCSDAVFVRRVYLDVIGRIPTAEEARRFLDDKDPNRRAALIDRLLEHRDFADFWAMRWCDLLRVKSEFPINLWPNAVQAYHHWIRTSMRENLPYDRFARALLTSSGSNFRNPPVNFYRAVQKKDAPTLARAVALTFMGVRPEGWPKEKWAGMETFFSQVGYKQTREWKEEVVFFDTTRPLKAAARPMQVGRESPSGPTVASDTLDKVFPDGTRATIEADQDPREVFADWLINPKNPWFTRNIANRAWSWLVGRGIIHEVDDIRPDNPPSNPELLAHLEQELIRANYDLRHLFRVILNSRTYQASCIPASEAPEAAALFAFYPVRRLEAEVLIDAICQVTGTTEKYSSPIPEPFTYIPESHRSVSLADASITSSFLEMFGRSPRDTGLASERNNNFTAAQRLHLLNSAHIRNKIDQGPGLQQVLGAGGRPEEVADRLYLTILSRYPTEEERAILARYSYDGEGQRASLDVAWALMNTAEFLCRH
jgi:Protein of unknown function (DUF1553)/Protein of unknown function (DUF1549)